MWRRTIVIGLLAGVTIGLGAVIARRGCEGLAVATPAAEAPRIASLSPGITRTLADLGLADHLVGRTPWCRSFDQVPVIGDLYELDYEQLVRVDPTHVFVQPSGTVEPRLVSLADKHDWTLVRWSLDDRADIERLVGDLPGVLFPADDDRAEVLRKLTQTRLEGLAHAFRPWAGETARPPATLLLLDGEAPLAFGSGTYLADLLDAVGVPNAAPCKDWCELSLEDLVRIDPPVIVLVDSRTDDAPTGVSPRLAALPLTAIREGRVVVLRHPDALVPSSTLVEVAERLRAILAGIEGRGA